MALFRATTKTTIGESSLKAWPCKRPPIVNRWLYDSSLHVTENLSCWQYNNNWHEVNLLSTCQSKRSFPRAVLSPGLYGVNCYTTIGHSSLIVERRAEISLTDSWKRASTNIYLAVDGWNNPSWHNRGKIMAWHCLESHHAREIWKGSFIPTVRPTIHTNPSRKRSFLKMISKRRNLKTLAFVLVWKRKRFENVEITAITWLPYQSFPQTQILNVRWLLHAF